ncbi:hypothetical protein ORU98_04520 [Pasteurella multocida]|uniref:hypothetical protein n=1 Tax=Pasteurella multocida TaxID=747 RepID=UPI002250C591|nr:hypothetical protein [Pasteurella multocida]UZU44711.1 hypothetical protein ORU98_04520 [Pasteurella multocida]
MKRRQIYAVYRGEKNLGDGTAEELEKKVSNIKKRKFMRFVHRMCINEIKGNS